MWGGHTPLGAQLLKAFFANVAQNLPSERPDPQRQGGHQQQALLISRGRSTAKSATTGGESSSAAGAAAHNLYPQGGERAHQQETLERPISNHRGGERAHEQEALQRNISNHRGARAQQQAAQKLSTSAPRSATTGGQMRFRRGTSYPTWGGVATAPGTYMSRVWDYPRPPRVGWYVWSP